jgi:hypothetical protein
MNTSTPNFMWWVFPSNLRNALRGHPSAYHYPSQFITPSKGIKVLGVLLNTITFTSSFIEKALQKDVRHWTFSLKWVMFKWPLKTCFVQHPSYLLWCTPPSSTFRESLTSFNTSLHEMFGRLLGPWSFNSPKGSLTHKQTFLPITFSGVRLISTSIIAPRVYLRSWALVILIIDVRFMVDQCPFLLKALAQVDNNTFHVQKHFQVACDLLPLPARVCFVHFNNSSGNKWFPFKIPSQSIYTIILFTACYLMKHLKPIVPKFYHVLA